MEFCIRDDDTSYFTSPDELEAVYGQVTLHGPVSLAIVPYHRAGRSKSVPERFRTQGTIHPLHDNGDLVAYLRDRISKGRFEVMLHGYHHDEPDGLPEFMNRKDLGQRVSRGRKYLEDLLGAAVRVFVPPGNTIGSAGLRAIARRSPSRRNGRRSCRLASYGSSDLEDMATPSQMATKRRSRESDGPRPRRPS